MIPILMLALGQAGLRYWPETPAADYHEAAVRVRQGQFAGSGCVVLHAGKLVVLTAEHVVNGGDGSRVELRSGPLEARVLTRDRTNDLAVLACRLPPRHPCLRVGSERDEPGTFELIGFGGPGSRRRHWSVTGHSFRHMLIADGYVISGDSGGPVLHRGRLVGIVSGGFRDYSAEELPGWTLHYPISAAGPEAVRAILDRAFE